MPTAPPRVCNRCKGPATKGQRCTCTPAPPSTSSSRRHARGRRWVALRAAKLRSQPFCEHPHCHALADEVDHIKPISQGGDEWKWSNLASICIPHHRDKTRREAHERSKRQVK
jgi:5-methylcytosine-specific restriction enzyme A